MDLRPSRTWVPVTDDDTGLLSLWTRTPIRLGGRLYPHAAGAFLAARTLDPEVRQALTVAAGRREALAVARDSRERADWAALRDRVADEVLRAAYRGDRGTVLVSTLPHLLGTGPVFSPLLEGIQGQVGLDRVTRLRGQLALAIAREARDGCWACTFGAPGAWAGFVRCAHPKGTPATLKCVGDLAVRGPGGAALVPVHGAGGRAFRAKGVLRQH